MQKDKKVSVIIPIYNGEKYLGECLDTIINQTYENIEIVLINDGSKDGTLEICKEYAAKDERVVIIDKENGGVTSARKAGVKSATGDFIFFVDCDDWVDEDSIEVLIGEVYNNGADVVVSGFVNETENGTADSQFGSLEEGIYDESRKEEFHKNMFYQGVLNGWGIWPTLWAKLYRKDLIERSLEELDERIFYGEDTACLVPACLWADKVSVLKKAKYHYRVLSATSVSAKPNKKLLDNMFYLHEYFSAFFQTLDDGEIFMGQLSNYMVSLMQHTGNLLFHIPYHLQEIEWVRPQVTEWQNRYFDLLNSNQRELALVEWIFPYYEIGDAKKIILYGAGKVGKSYYDQIKNCSDLEVVARMDKNTDSEVGIVGLHELENYTYDCIVVAVSNVKVATEIMQELKAAGAPQDKLIWVKPKKVKNLYSKMI